MMTYDERTTRAASRAAAEFPIARWCQTADGFRVYGRRGDAYDVTRFDGELVCSCPAGSYGQACWHRELVRGFGEVPAPTTIIAMPTCHTCGKPSKYAECVDCALFS